MISLKQVTKTYETPAGKFSALKDVSLNIPGGEFLAVIGKSGSGKSTFLNMVGGIDYPTSGSVHVGDMEVQTLSQTRLASWRGQNIGFVFQFFQLLPTLTAIENVILPMDFCRTFPAGQRRERARSLLDQVGLATHADKLPSALSGGEQQRVAIARALVNNPVVVLADEPTGNLDSTNALVILNLLRNMAKAGTTVLIATHERDIATLSDRTVEIADGALKE